VREGGGQIDFTLCAAAHKRVGLFCTAPQRKRERDDGGGIVNRKTSSIGIIFIIFSFQWHSHSRSSGGFAARAMPEVETRREGVGWIGEGL
jgi:hypothetical protein